MANGESSVSRIVGNPEKFCLFVPNSNPVGRNVSREGLQW